MNKKYIGHQNTDMVYNLNYDYKFKDYCKESLLNYLHNIISDSFFFDNNDVLQELLKM